MHDVTVFLAGSSISCKQKPQEPGVLMALPLMQEKLVNFMVPRQYEEPAIAGQLFQNLFAHSK